MPVNIDLEKEKIERIFNIYNTTKKLYALCEETDPELLTNLQPLNEFRAALDHLMRIVAISNLDEYKDRDPRVEAEKLTSHLNRALYDVCDMLSINYRNKIIDILQPYSSGEIKTALPTYYSQIRPRIEEISEEIASFRTTDRFNKEECGDSILDSYPNVIEELKGYYKTVSSAIPSLDEIFQEDQRIHKHNRARNIFTQWIIPIVSIVVAILLSLIGWFGKDLFA